MRLETNYGSLKISRHTDVDIPAVFSVKNALSGGNIYSTWQI